MLSHARPKVEISEARVPLETSIDKTGRWEPKNEDLKQSKYEEDVIGGSVGLP
jgi:hypothetical protein